MRNPDSDAVARLGAQDTTDAAGEAIKCEAEGELEVCKQQKTITVTLDADGGTRVVELDFKGYGGITAKLAVSTVEGSSDENVDVTSWRKVDVQPYHPAGGFFKGNDFPEALAKKVKESFDEVFIDVEFLESRPLGSAFLGIEAEGKFEIVEISAAHAKAAGLDPGPRTGSAALVYSRWAGLSDRRLWTGSRSSAAPAGQIRRPRFMLSSPTVATKRGQCRQA